MPTEAKLIASIKEHFRGKVYFYKVNGSGTGLKEKMEIACPKCKESIDISSALTEIGCPGYGDQGFPDLIAFYNGKVFFFEAKNATSYEEAKKKLRPSQRCMHKFLEKMGIHVYLLYQTGVDEKKDTFPFEQIEKILGIY